MNNFSNNNIGVLYALAAFIAWGLVPLFFKLIDQVPALETLGHRAIWASLCLAIWLQYKKNWKHVATALVAPRVFLCLLLSTLFIATNWGVFIWAVNAGNILETSLGYFINPLVNILLGRLILAEKLRPAQWLAVLLATAGTLNLVFQYGHFPWVAITLAISFGFYGLLRKTTDVQSLPGLFIETLLLAPLAIGYLFFLSYNEQGHFTHSGITIDLLLILSGVVTVLPLLWFVNAAQRLRLSTVGFFQYIAPTMSFFLAVFLYKETFTITHFITFLCIWIGLAIFTVDSLKTRNSGQ